VLHVLQKWCNFRPGHWPERINSDINFYGKTLLLLHSDTHTDTHTRPVIHKNNVAGSLANLLLSHPYTLILILNSHILTHTDAQTKLQPTLMMWFCTADGSLLPKIESNSSVDMK